MSGVAGRGRHLLRTALFSALLVAAPLSAQDPSLPPDSLAHEFQTAIRSRAWDAVAARIHPERLARFHRWVVILLDVPGTADARRRVLGDTARAAYTDAPPRRLFFRLLEGLGEEYGGLMNALVARDVEILGTVREGDALAHVVYRNMDWLSGAVPEIRVTTLGRTASGWRVLESDELDLIRESLRGLLRRTTPPGGPGDQSGRSPWSTMHSPHPRARFVTATRGREPSLDDPEISCMIHAWLPRPSPWISKPMSSSGSGRGESSRSPTS